MYIVFVNNDIAVHCKCEEVHTATKGILHVQVEVLDAKLASMEREDAAAATTERNESEFDNECCSNRVESVESLSNKRRRR